MEEVIAEQDLANSKALDAAALYKQASEANRDAFLKQQQATLTAEEAWKLEQEERKRLAKKLKWSRTRTNVAIIAGISAAVTLYLLKK